MRFKSRVNAVFLGLLTLLLVGACGTSSDEGVATGTASQPEAGGGQVAQTGVQQVAATPTRTPRPAIKASGATIEITEGTISPAVASAHMGEEIKVCGFVEEAVYEKDMEGRPTFLRFDGTSPDHPFQVIIPGKRRPRWPQPPELIYGSGQSCAKGLIEDIDGKPTMIIEQAYNLSGGGGMETLPSRQQLEMERKEREAERTKEAQK